MKKIFLFAMFSIGLFSCQTSEGLKYGVLQKVSHKTFPCSYYAAEFAFEGGRMVSDGKSSSYQNTQEVKITNSQYDSLQQFVGQKMVFDYKDDGFAVCGSSKILTLYRKVQ